MNKRAALLALGHRHDLDPKPNPNELIDFVLRLLAPKKASHKKAKQTPRTVFDTESDMVAYFAKNLGSIEPGLELFCTDGTPGLACPLDVKASKSPEIDILAVDRGERLVVIECKIGRGNPAVVGQIAAYRAWLMEHLAEPDDPVRAIVIVKVASPMLKLLLAHEPAPWLTVYEYDDQGNLTTVKPTTTP